MGEMMQHDLGRFLKAQDHAYDKALEEIIRGQKQSHWIWYIFPQVKGLGSSPVAQKFAIESKGEAVAYLEHEVLGGRLMQCAEALLSHVDKNITAIMGHPDEIKLRSSMTLFAAISSPDSVFARVLAQFYSGNQDQVTIEFLEDNP